MCIEGLEKGDWNRGLVGVENSAEFLDRFYPLHAVGNGGSGKLVAIIVGDINIPAPEVLPQFEQVIF